MSRTQTGQSPVYEPVVVALSTCPDEGTARTIAETLVSENLAACVNRVPGIRSTYRWDDRLQDDAEVLLVIKTCQSRMAALQQRLQALHPYELPELIAVPVVAGNEAYLQWVRQGVTKGTSE
jgi:periplasmic divalent cation tolerance protein